MTVICPRAYSQSNRRHYVPILLAPILLFITTGVLAFADLTIRLQSHLEALAGSAWQAKGIDVQVIQDNNSQRHLRILIERLDIPALLPPLEGVELQCRDFVLSLEQIHCRTGQLHVSRLHNRSIAGRLSLRYLRADDLLQFTLTNLDLADGRIAVKGSWRKDGWHFEVQATSLDVAALSVLLEKLPYRSWDPGQNKGQIDTLRVTLSGRGTTLEDAQFQVTGQGLSLSAAGGHYAIQDLSLQLQGLWRSGEFTATLLAFAGQAYFQPVFIELPAQAERPMTVKVIGRLRRDRLELSSLALNHPGVVQAEGGLTLTLSQGIKLHRADITVINAVFPGVYSSYVKPFMATMDELKTEGRIHGQIVFSDDALQTLALDLMDLHVKDGQGRFAVNGLSGRMAWSRDSPVPQHSSLYWRGGQLYQLKLGPGGLALLSQEGKFQLLGQGRIPILDGAIVIDRMQGKGLGSKDFSWQFEGMLTPVSMEVLCRALDWPLLSGKLSGMIPDVRYADHRLEVGGALLIRLFKGTITITHLRIENLLGTMPEVFADVDLRNLDLLALTHTFDFGKIEGKLEGRITDLHLENWQPTRFDAVFETPRNDDSRHVISQQAVENISALGGGGPTVTLSRGFLSMFESFNYKRLGLSCRLQNEVCEMGGVAPAKQGYYLVEGQGLPRIDVIGFNRRVDWLELLARLKTAVKAAHTEGVVVQ